MAYPPGTLTGAGWVVDPIPWRLLETQVNGAGIARPTMAYFEQKAAPAAAGVYDFHAVDTLLTVEAANANFSASTGLYAVEGKVNTQLSAGQTIGRVVGVFGSAVNSSSSGTVTTAIGVQAEVQALGGAITNGVAIWIKNPTISGGTIGSAYGLFIQNITGGSDNYAIQTNQGKINFFAGTAIPAGGTANVGVTMSSTARFGMFFGSGAPTLQAAQGSIYLRSDGSATNNRCYVNTDGNTTWTAITTAA